MSELTIEYNSTFSECFESQHRYLILKGGAGSGKSVFAAQKIVARTIAEEGHRMLVMRKVSRTIRESVWELVLNTFREFGHSHLIKVNKSDRVITYLPNDNKLIFAGVDDPEKLKSIVGITGAWLEELTEFDEGDLDQLDLRLRGVTNWYKQITGTFNPIDARHWLKPKFFDSPDESVFTHESTFRDNTFLDQEYIDTLMNRLSSDQNLFNIYVLNKWGRPQTGLEIYTKFDLKTHVVDSFKYDKTAPLHVTFDFNVVPHVTVNVWQVTRAEVGEGDEVRDVSTATQIDEICLTDPLNNTPSAAEAFATKYANHEGGVWLYGDPSGRGRDTRSEEGRNDFDLILDKIRHLNPIDRVQPSAPNVVSRTQWLNNVLHVDDEIKIRISSECDITIEDFQQVKTAADGSKLKRRIKNKLTGVTYEQHGHSTDANEYFLTTLFESEFSVYKRGYIDDDKRMITPRREIRKKRF